MTRLTVWWLTPASLATSYMPGGRARCGIDDGVDKGLSNPLVTEADEN